MSVSYDVFTEAFLDKVEDFAFAIGGQDNVDMVDRYMKRAISSFRKICKYDLSTTGDDDLREFNVYIPPDDLEEIIDIISEGMLVHWMKPFVHKQENLENVLNTRDFSSYSPSELVFRINEAYKQAQTNYVNRMRGYSYDHGDLTDLHM